MWVEQLSIENMRCFEKATLRFNTNRQEHCRWITFLGENGGGKSTALQALGLLLAGPEAAQTLLPRPVGWVRDETTTGKVSISIHQDEADPGKFGEQKVRKVFNYSLNVTGGKKLTFNNKVYSEPSIVCASQKPLAWLRANAFVSKGSGWFAVGYGAFRRLTRSSQIIVPSFEPQARFTNFATQFDESDPLSVFERWMVYLDYRIAKEKGDQTAKRQKDMGITAMNAVLPAGTTFDSVSSEGRVNFRVGRKIVPTISLSDGYRSVLALAGDMIWRLILAFPDSSDPLQEPGVVLIDELDIHLHPAWQREIPGMLRKLFPKLQFFVATHSPLVAAGAGDDALTLRFRFDEGRAVVDEVPNPAAMNVDRILQSEAFGLVSPYAPQTEEKINRFDALTRKGGKRTVTEESERQGLLDFMKEARPIGGPPEPGSLAARVEAYIDETLAR